MFTLDTFNLGSPLGEKSGLETASREVKGHAFTLALMGRYPEFLTGGMEEGRTSWHNMFWIKRLCR